MSELHQIEGALTSDLATIQIHWDALLAAATPSGVTIGGGSRGSLITADDHAETDADVDRVTRIVSLRRLITDVLNGWSRVVMEDRPVEVELPNGSDVPGMCAFLIRHAQWFAGHEAAEDAAEEVRRLAGKVSGAVNPQRKDWISLGACPLDVDSEVGPVKCGGQVRVRPSRDGGAAEGRCRKCGVVAVVEWWERVIMPEASRLITAAEVPEFIRQQFGKKIAAPTVRKWIERHVITAAGTDEKGRTLYDKGAVAYAIARREAVGA